MTKPLALLFPGQGSQEAGMGRDMAEADKETMDLWKQAESISGIRLREIYWDNDEDALSDTRNVQPALTVVNLATFLGVHTKLSPMGMAGHSLGEYSALAAAGVLSPADVLELVSLRGRLMAEADPDGRGAMAAVLKLSQEQVQGMVDDVAGQDLGLIRIANYNSPAQYVVSGDKDAVEALGPLAKEAKGRLVPLPVSGAFHSPLMDEPAAEFARALRSKTWNAARTPVYLNITGKPERDPEVLKEAMCRQMTSSVLWIQTMAALYEDGARRFLELGPKNVLARLATPNLKDRDEDIETASVNSKDAMDTLF